MRDPEGSLIQSSFVILVVMLLVVLVGSVAIVLPALYALNQLQNSLMERLLGIPPQVLTVRFGVSLIVPLRKRPMFLRLLS